MIGKGAVRTVVALAATLASLAALSACGGSDPENLTFDVTIADRSLDPKVIKVKQGDTVTLNFRPEEHGSVHLHGYDIEKNVAVGEVTTMEFVANATGNFGITLHASAGGHAELFESTTLEQGDAFTYKIYDDMGEGMIPYHNHMDHEMTGSIHVEAAAQQPATVQVSVQEDGSFEPASVAVGPGSTVVWTNTGSKRARVTSGEPPALAEGESEEEGEHEHEEEAEEVPLGSLEVHPR
ncbi:MAG: cupredoxin domain-containing protein [Chloroflexi bacterium]|nr:cupredoxin domain-containing protein [Chloroflexota bacterium]